MIYEPPEDLNIADYFLGDRLREGLGEHIALRLDGETRTYADLGALSGRFARLYESLALRREERVLIALPDGPEFVGALFGALRIGAVGVMLNPALGAEEVAALFDYSDARLAVVHESCLETFEAARDLASSSPGLLQIGGEPGLHGRFEDFPEDPQDAEFRSAPTHRDDPALWLFSGGTTGRPKAVVQTHGSFANTTELYAKGVLGYGPEDITLSVPKLFFGYATGSNLFFPMSVGASAVLFAEKPTPEALFERIRRHRPTVLINVPTLIQRMVSHPEAETQDLSSLRFSTSAGEALPIALHARFRDLFGVEVLDGLGTSEMWHVFLTNRLGDVKPGTLGRVVPGFEVSLRDAEGHEVEDGEVGRLWVRGRSRALGYWRNLPKTSEAFRGEWFVGGDLARRDAEGYVTYCGRGDDAFKVGGKWLLPGELEDCLLEHPEVSECAVVGAVEPDGLVKPHAFVRSEAPQPDQLAEALKDHALKRLQPYKHPRRVTVLRDLPRTHLGKIDRGKLKRMAEA